RNLRAVIRLDAATVLLQWATGGLFFLWVTSRRREVGIGYGWLLRAVYGAMAGLAVVAGRELHPSTVRDVAAGLVAAATFVALAVSVARRKAGVAGERARRDRRAARVRAMVGERAEAGRTGAAESAPTGPSREVPPALGLVG